MKVSRGERSIFAGNSALVPFDVIHFVMLPALSPLAETVLLLDGS